MTQIDHSLIRNRKRRDCHVILSVRKDVSGIERSTDLKGSGEGGKAVMEVDFEQNELPELPGNLGVCVKRARLCMR